jgi:hypothetical protein
MYDISTELKNYRDHLKGKIVYCNCDNPLRSEFVKYFFLCFDFLELKKVVVTHYVEGGQSYKLEILQQLNEVDDIPAYVEANKVMLEGDGDFRSPECVEILEEVDVVVTNPPFSLFREFVDLIMTKNKKLLVVGNANAIAYRDIFAYIKNEELWLGVNPRGMDFKMPNGEMKNINAAWLTNMDFTKRHEDIILYRTYDEKAYPKYVNLDAINVDKTKDIPMDYEGLMGVPISFLDKFSPDQFEIVGMSSSWSMPLKEKKVEIMKDYKPTGKITKPTMLIRKYDPELLDSNRSPSYRDVETGELYFKPYQRIIIKNKKVCKTGVYLAS